MVNIQKAAIIGCGFVGASSAFSLLQKGIFSELVLIDANKEKAEGEAMDISHGRPYAHPMKIYAGSYDDISDCSLIIMFVQSVLNLTSFDFVDSFCNVHCYCTSLRVWH